MLSGPAESGQGSRLLQLSANALTPSFKQNSIPPGTFNLPDSLSVPHNSESIILMQLNTCFIFGEYSGLKCPESRFFALLNKFL